MSRLGDWSEFEWDIEEVHAVETDLIEEGEVLDHNFLESAAEGVAFLQKHKTAPADIRYEMVLVLDTDDGRSWAYVDMETMMLPLHFEDAERCKTRKVAKRFHNELAKAVKYAAKAA